MSRPPMPHSVSPPPGDERSVPRPPPGRGADLDPAALAADIAVIWVLLAAFAVTVYVLLALAIQSVYRAV